MPTKYPKIDIWFYDEDKYEDIFCFAEVIHYLNVAPNPHTWDSDFDYYGYTEIEYQLVDEEGNPLNIEVSKAVDSYIQQKIIDYYEEE